MQLDEKTEREPLLTWAPTPPKTHPINYFVPNFGVDYEISDSQNNMNAAEKSLSHTWNYDFDPDHKMNTEIEFRLLQTDSELNTDSKVDSESKREPLLTWAPTPPKTHPINYFVPDFGVD